MRFIMPPQQEESSVRWSCPGEDARIPPLMNAWTRYLAAAGLLLTCLASPVLADFKKGMTAYEAGDYATALKMWRPLAEQGNTDAQYGLGLMYDGGKGVPQDNAEAARWYRKAAEQGLASAQSNLGVLYARGEGVPQDNAQAARWYRRAAEQEYAMAQFNLGVLYEKGHGVKQDYTEAVFWYRR